MFGIFKRKRGAEKVQIADRPPLRDGIIALGERLVVNRSLTEAAFLEIAGKDATRGVHNGKYRSYWISSATLYGRCFKPNIYFEDGRLTVVVLEWDDGEGSDPWKDWSEARQLQIARADAAWLRSVLKGLEATASPYSLGWDTTRSTYALGWGVISSGYDARSGGASVVVRYYS